MDFGIASVPERVKSSGPWGDPPRERQKHQNSEADDKDEDHKGSQEQLELSSRHHLPDNLDEGDKLQKSEDAESSHVFTRPDRQVFDEWHLHRRDCAKDVPRRVRRVESVVEAAHQDQDERV